MQKRGASSRGGPKREGKRRFFYRRAKVNPLLEKADHGFKAPKSPGKKTKTAREIEDEVARAVLAFMDSRGD